MVKYSIALFLNLIMPEEVEEIGSTAGDSVTDQVDMGELAPKLE
jgi:hypothetical protein